MPIIHKEQQKQQETKQDLEVTYTLYINNPTRDQLWKMTSWRPRSSNEYFGPLITDELDRLVQHRLDNLIYGPEGFTTEYNANITNSINDPVRRLTVTYIIRVHDATEDQCARMNPHKDYPGDGLVETMYWRLDHLIQEHLGIRFGEYRSSYNIVVTKLEP